MFATVCTNYTLYTVGILHFIIGSPKCVILTKLHSKLPKNRHFRLLKSMCWCFCSTIIVLAMKNAFFFDLHQIKSTGSALWDFEK